MEQPQIYTAPRQHFEQLEDRSIRAVLLDVHLFDVGGADEDRLARVGEPLRTAVKSALTPFLMEVFQPGPPIRLAVLGEDAVPVGALRLAALALGG